MSITVAKYLVKTVEIRWHCLGSSVAPGLEVEVVATDLAAVAAAAAVVVINNNELQSLYCAAELLQCVGGPLRLCSAESV